MSFLQTLAAAFKGGGERVPLARSFTSPWFFADAFPGGDRAASYDYPRAVQQAYLDNPVAQRAVRLVAEGIGGAPLLPTEPALAKLVAATSAGQSLLETLASHLLLHGARSMVSTASACSPLRWVRSDGLRRCPPAMRCERGPCPRWRRSLRPAASSRPKKPLCRATC